MTVIKLVAGEEGRLQRSESEEALLNTALHNLDLMREDLIAGRIKAFAAVGIATDHSTFMWSGKTASTTNLELKGACWALLLNGT